MTSLLLIWFFYTWFVASVSILLYKKVYEAKTNTLTPPKQKIRKNEYEFNLHKN